MICPTFEIDKKEKTNEENVGTTRPNQTEPNRKRATEILREIEGGGENGGKGQRRGIWGSLGRGEAIQQTTNALRIATPISSVADAFACAARDCVCVWISCGKSGIRISVRRRTRIECADSSYAVEHKNYRIAYT